MPEPSPEILRSDRQHIGRQVWLYPSLDSTNTLALALADRVDLDGLAILAREQTAGRGQHGRTWQATPASSVLLSVLLFPPAHLRRTPVFISWAAVAVAETVLRLANQQARIKWPNDVLLLGKKICGILIEQRTTSNPDAPLATVIGIGLNVRQTAEDFAAGGLTLAGSLRSQAAVELDTRQVAEVLLEELDAAYAPLVRGETGDLESLWKWRLGLLGKQVWVEGVHQRHAGRLLDVTFAGVELEQEDGVIVLAPESIRQLVEVKAQDD